MKNITNQFIEAGFKKELRLWSFSPKLRNGSYYYSKFIEYDTYDIEIGVVVDESSSLMEVYFCSCVVACCGISYGVHPISLKTIDNLLEEYKQDFR